MARRRGGWQEFTDSFNSVYGTFNKVAQDYEVGKVMRDEPTPDDETYTEEQGGLGFAVTPRWKYGDQTFDTKPTPEKVQELQWQRLQGIYNKYNEHEKSLAIQEKLGGIKNRDMMNEILAAVKGDKIKQEGGLSTRGLEAEVVKKEADASVAKQTVNPEVQRLIAESDAAQSRATVLDGTVDAKILKEISEANTAKTNDEINTNTQTAQQNLVKYGAEISKVKASIAKLTEKDVVDKVKYETQLKGLEYKKANALYNMEKPLNDALTSFQQRAAMDPNDGGFKTPDEAAKAFLDIYSKHDPAAATALQKNFQSQQIVDILQESVVNAAEVKAILADPKGDNINKAIAWFDEKNGKKLGIEFAENPDEPGGGAIYETKVDPETGEKIIVRTIAEGNAEQLRTKLEYYVTPGGAAKMTADMEASKKAVADLGLTKSKTKLNEVTSEFYTPRPEQQNQKAKDDLVKSPGWADLSPEEQLKLLDQIDFNAGAGGFVSGRVGATGAPAGAAGLSNPQAPYLPPPVRGTLAEEEARMRQQSNGGLSGGR